ncbi:MAG: trypsin-like serine protease [Labilithrix sp.]|nr:trypsin-like serine protease [Labilithrix sp.]MCW5810429.1 trypsin-like serine protease [Labilithrix sp.]
MRLAGITASTVLCGVLAIVGCSSSAKDELGTATANVQGGEIDNTHRFAVGVRSNNGICSGALILPNLVATARHCVSASPQRIDCTKNPTFGADKTGFWITTNTSLNGNPSTSPGWYRAKSIYRPNDPHICGNDIALIVLEKSVPETEAKPITPGVQHKMYDATRFVPSFTAIGYGRTMPASMGGNGGAGTRRILSGIDVRCVPGSPTMNCPSFVDTKEFIGGSGICQGDSGSSAFETSSFEAEDPVSFGVLSRGGESADGTACEGSLYTRFDAHRDFVLDVAKIASQSWTLYDEPAWTAQIDAPDDNESKPDAGGGNTTAGGDVENGGTCKKSKDCASGVCVEVDDVRVCAETCEEDEEDTCGKGFSCQWGFCLRAPKKTVETTPSTSGGETAGGDLGAAPQTQTITTTSCAFSGSSANGSSGALLGLGLALAAAMRRRKR